MRDIVPIKGATAYTINLDPSVWIFDKRKIKLEPYIESGEKITVKEREVSGSYGIPFEPFLKNAEPVPAAKQVICHLENGEQVRLSLTEAREAILAFAQDGKPLKSDGPLHLIFGGSRRKEKPITHIVAFEVTE